MRSFSTLACLALPLFGSVFAEQQKQPEQPSTIYNSAHEAFQDLLNALPEESLHAALSGLKDFKNGIFESHHRGVEQVHNKNPALATKLIVAAVQDLKKRQTPSNGTVVPQPPPQQTTRDQPPPGNTPPAEQSSPAAPPPANTPDNTPTPAPNSPAPNEPDSTPTPSPERPVIIPVEQTVTDNAGSTIIQTSSILSQVTASVRVTVTRTNAAGAPITTTENRPAVIRTVTDAQGRTSTTTSAAQFAPTSGEVRTETDAGGKTFVTTYTPDGGVISSIKLITSTGRDGKPTVITSYTYADPYATPTAVEGGPDQTTGKTTVQTTGAAVLNKAVVGYALAGGALAIFA